MNTYHKILSIITLILTIFILDSIPLDKAYAWMQSTCPTEYSSGVPGSFLCYWRECFSGKCTEKASTIGIGGITESQCTSKKLL